MKMTRIQETLLTANEQDLVGPLRQALGQELQNPAFREAYQRSETTRKLLALKNYEHPDPAAEDRCVRAVRIMIAETHPNFGSPMQLNWVQAISGAVTVCAAVFALHFTFTSRVPPLQSAATPAPARPVAPAVAPAAATELAEEDVFPTLEEFLVSRENPYILVPTSDTYPSSNRYAPPIIQDRSSIFFTNE